MANISKSKAYEKKYNTIFKYIIMKFFNTNNNRTYSFV